MTECTEALAEDAMLIPSESGREHDDVALVALNVLYILDEEAHILAGFDTLAFPHQGIAKCLVAFCTLFQSILDRVRLLAVESHNADRRRRSILPEAAEILHHIGGFLGIGLALVDAVRAENLDRLEPPDGFVGMTNRHAETVRVERGVRKRDE